MKHLALTVALAGILFALNGCAVYTSPYSNLDAYYGGGYGYPYYRSYGFEPRFYGYYGFRPRFYGGYYGFRPHYHGRAWGGRGWRGHGRR